MGKQMNEENADTAVYTLRHTYEYTYTKNEQFIIYHCIAYHLIHAHATSQW